MRYTLFLPSSLFSFQSSLLPAPCSLLPAPFKPEICTSQVLELL
ncbi:hypothetical protein [Moorena sp. SIO3H5]|nr:hypothetical protein [Moorena sp. SIO3H5]